MTARSPVTDPQGSRNPKLRRGLGWRTMEQGSAGGVQVGERGQGPRGHGVRLSTALTPLLRPGLQLPLPPCLWRGSAPQRCHLQSGRGPSSSDKQQREGENLSILCLPCCPHLSHSGPEQKPFAETVGAGLRASRRVSSLVPTNTRKHTQPPAWLPDALPHPEWARPSLYATIPPCPPLGEKRSSKKL